MAEPVKAARLILGVDDSAPGEVKLIPRLPPSWQGMQASGWPIRAGDGTARADIRVERESGGLHMTLKLSGGARIPRLAVRLPSGDGYTWHRFDDVGDLGHLAGNG